MCARKSCAAPGRRKGGRRAPCSRPKCARRGCEAPGRRRGCRRSCTQRQRPSYPSVSSMPRPRGRAWVGSRNCRRCGSCCRGSDCPAKARCWFARRSAKSVRPHTRESSCASATAWTPRATLCPPTRLTCALQRECVAAAARCAHAPGQASRIRHLAPTGGLQARRRTRASGNSPQTRAEASCLCCAGRRRSARLPFRFPPGRCTACR
mmetsp:Transcript_19346/g.49179  ORF Transcript_19346/g.49179 Transcript_19346/m.49179 type:complete len:208 (+) Transcript_19346:1840-2463(+)